MTGETRTQKEFQYGKERRVDSSGSVKLNSKSVSLRENLAVAIANSTLNALGDYPQKMTSERMFQKIKCL